MEKVLHLEGFVDFHPGDERVLLTPKKDDMYKNLNIVNEIRDFITRKHVNGEQYDLSEGGMCGLGQEVATIYDCNISMYFTRSKKTLEEAMMIVDEILYGGEYESVIDYDGYSEFTITDLILTTFQIGGHDLEEIFKSKRGDYCHFILRTE